MTSREILCKQMAEFIVDRWDIDNLTIDMLRNIFNLPFIKDKKDLTLELTNNLLLVFYEGKCTCR